MFSWKSPRGHGVARWTPPRLLCLDVGTDLQNNIRPSTTLVWDVLAGERRQRLPQQVSEVSKPPCLSAGAELHDDARGRDR